MVAVCFRLFYAALTLSSLLLTGRCGEGVEGSGMAVCASRGRWGCVHVPVLVSCTGQSSTKAFVLRSWRTMKQCAAAAYPFIKCDHRLSSVPLAIRVLLVSCGGEEKEDSGMAARSGGAGGFGSLWYQYSDHSHVHCLSSCSCPHHLIIIIIITFVFPKRRGKLRISNKI
jgi:hypothetical protein